MVTLAFFIVPSNVPNFMVVLSSLFTLSENHGMKNGKKLRAYVSKNPTIKRTSILRLSYKKKGKIN